MKKIFNLILAAFVLLGTASCDGLFSPTGGNGSSSSDFTIKISNVSATNATVGVTTTYSGTYYFDVMEQDVVDAYDSLAEFAEAYAEYLQEYAAQYGLTFADAISSGNDSYIFTTLNPNTKYYAFVFGLNTNGVVTTDVTLKAFTTLSGGGVTSKNTFSVDVTNITADGATISVTPSNSDTYYFDVVEKAVYSSYADGKEFAVEYINYLKYYYEGYGINLTDLLSSGADSYTYGGDNPLSPGTGYVAFAIGVSTNGEITTNIEIEEFTTLSGGSDSGSGSTPGDKNISNLVQGWFTNYGDFYEMGATNYWIDIYNADYSEALILDLQAAPSATSFVGTYPFNLSYEAGSAISGFIYDSYFCGSYWAALSASGSVSDYALISDGSVTISKDGDNYVLSLNATTDDGYTITASYNGVLEEEVATLSVLSNGSKCKGFRVAGLDSFKKLASAPAKFSLKKQMNVEPKVSKFAVNKAFGK